MNIEAAPMIKNPPAQFAGDLWVDMIAAPHTADQRMTVAVVRFRPGARTAWHSHARGCFMEHIAMFEAGDDPATTTTWKEHITDAEFLGTPPTERTAS